ncbi:MAG: CPBP family glutamic-type intramembrane protease [Minicystis sp.]
MMQGEPQRDPIREAIVLVLAVVLLTVVHFHGFTGGLDPGGTLAAWFAFNIVLLLGVPVLVIRVVFREPLADWGLGLGRPRVWGADLARLAVVVLPAAFLIARLPAIRATYPVYRAVLGEPWLWIPSTLGWGAYCFAWEFFFRGFLLFGLGRRLGPLAVFVQMVPFVMAHYPKSEAETLLAIPAGLVLGVLAWRGESLLGAWILHWFAATAVNVFAAIGAR